MDLVRCTDFSRASLEASSALVEWPQAFPACSRQASWAPLLLCSAAARWLLAARSWWYAADVCASFGIDGDSSMALHARRCPSPLTAHSRHPGRFTATKAQSVTAPLRSRLG